MYEWKELGFDLDLRDMRLVRFGQDEAPVWMTELEKMEARAKGLKFMDITDHPDLGFSNLFAPGGKKNTFEYPSPSKVNSTTHECIESLFPSISTTSMKELLKTFSSFRTRYYKSSTGAESSE